MGVKEIKVRSERRERGWEEEEEEEEEECRQDGLLRDGMMFG